jgi:hypothetical protein
MSTTAKNVRAQAKQDKQREKAARQVQRNEEDVGPMACPTMQRHPPPRILLKSELEVGKRCYGRPP